MTNKSTKNLSNACSKSKQANFEDKLKFETEYTSKGFVNICGCDEAGRGPLAGPVVVASVIMPLSRASLIEGVDDSKKLSEQKREELYEKIIKTARAFKVAIISEKVIDEINILNATKQGMTQAITGLNIKPDLALIDAVSGLNLSCETVSIIKGDAKSYLIGCASIIAKVTRDRIMREYSKQYPNYHFEKHKGYGTKEHIELLKKFGKCDIHRESFIKHFQS
ncbi:MAG: ribonuclease HII [Christensenellales bacterium]